MNAYTAIAHMSPCVDASDWLKTQSDAQTAWNTCVRGDWMMWVLAKTAMNHRTSVTLACRFARMALTHVTSGDNRPLAAIEAAESWLANPCEETRDAAHAAYAEQANIIREIAPVCPFDIPKLPVDTTHE